VLGVHDVVKGEYPVLKIFKTESGRIGIASPQLDGLYLDTVEKVLVEDYRFVGDYKRADARCVQVVAPDKETAEWIGGAVHFRVNLFGIRRFEQFVRESDDEYEELLSALEEAVKKPIFPQVCLLHNGELEYRLGDNQVVDLNDVLTLKEASQLVGVDPSALRHAIRSGRFREDEVRQSGGVWLVTRQGLERVYGTKD
jgi:hypothetical protein